MGDCLSTEVFEVEEDTLKERYLTFSLEKETYGIEIQFVTEIIGIQPITEVPELPDYVRGIINLRGKIIPVMDVRLRFKKKFREYNERTCIIIIEMQNMSIGLIVDSVAEVITIKDSEIVPVPDLNREGSKYISGIAKVLNEIMLLLDCDKLLNYDELQNLVNC